jgi:hypothetical protein
MDGDGVACFFSFIAAVFFLFGRFFDRGQGVPPPACRLFLFVCFGWLIDGGGGGW